MAKKVFGSFLILLFSFLIFTYFKSGAYKSVEAEKTTAPKLQLFYVENVGPYHKIMENLSYVEEEFKKLGTPCPRTFGHFLSDPKIIDHEKLISHVGCAFKVDESPQLFTLPDRVKEKFFGSEDNNPNRVCFKGSFKGSPALSAIKVYPVLKEMAQKNKVKLSKDYLEVYTVDDDSVKTDVYLCSSGAR